MSRQAFELLDFESGYRYSLETATDILPSNFTLVLPERNGTLALTKDVDDLSGKLVRGDIVVGDSKKLDGKSLSEIALSDMSNVTLTPEVIDSLRGYTGSAGTAGPIGLQGGTGYTGSAGANGATGYTGSVGFTGSKGADGVAGSAGPIGTQGYTGSKGDTGPMGPQGPAGTSGGSGTENAITLDDWPIDLTAGNYFTGDAMMLSMSSPYVSGVKSSGQVTSFVIELFGGGSYTIYWTGIGTINWPSGTAPTLSPNGKDILAFLSIDGGSSWRGLVLAKDIR